MLTRRTLNRTLLARQCLLERVDASPMRMTEHLLGLQAQATLPPYVGLWSRLRDFDPVSFSEFLATREAVRIVVMRGTIHLLSRADALQLRPLMQEVLDRQAGGSDWGKAISDVDRGDLEAAARDVLTGGVVTNKDLGAALAEGFPGHRPGDLANGVRTLLPLVQVPPRGQWKRSGGPTYSLVEDWLGAPTAEAPDFTEVVRRYLRAFGPASAADVTTWCGRTGVAQTLTEMSDELVSHRDENGKELFDLAGLELADPGTPAPVRLLGQYDNVFLSHNDRARIFEDRYRSRWMGVNGVAGAAVLVDGFLEGLWRVEDGRVVLDLFRDLTRTEKREVDDAVGELESFLALP